MGNAGRDVGYVSGVEDDFFSALKVGAEGFTGAGAVGVLSLHGAAGDERDRALLDDYLVDPKLVALGAAGVDANDEKGAVVPEVVHDLGCEASGAGFCGSEEFGFALGQVGGGVDGGVSGLR